MNSTGVILCRLPRAQRAALPWRTQRRESARREVPRNDQEAGEGHVRPELGSV